MKYRLSYSIIAICLIIVLMPLIMGTLMLTQMIAHSPYYSGFVGRSCTFAVGKDVTPPKVLINSTPVYKFLMSYNVSMYRKMMELLIPSKVRMALNIEMELLPASKEVLTNTSIMGYVKVGKALIKYVVSYDKVDYYVLRRYGDLDIMILKPKEEPARLVINFKNLSPTDYVMINNTKVILSKSAEAPIEARLRINLDALIGIKRVQYVKALIYIASSLVVVVTVLLLIAIISRRTSKSLLINSHISSF